MDSKPLHWLANTDDIPEGKGKIVKLPDGEELALFHQNGKFYALSNACPHMGGPLGEGELEQGCVTCPWHGWQFDLSSGECINCPGEDAQPYSIVIQDGAIFLASS